MTNPIGARSATGREHSGLRWLPWVLLLLLALIIVGVILLVANVDDDDDTARNQAIGTAGRAPITLVA